MNLLEAAKALREGHKIKRKGWVRGVFIYSVGNDMSNEVVRQFNNKILTWNFVGHDLLADDWEIYEEHSIIDKAWNTALGNEDDEISLGEGLKDREIFKLGWKAAEKHFNQKDKSDNHET